MHTRTQAALLARGGVQRLDVFGVGQSLLQAAVVKSGPRSFVAVAMTAQPVVVCSSPVRGPARLRLPLFSHARTSCWASLRAFFSASDCLRRGAFMARSSLAAPPSCSSLLHGGPVLFSCGHAAASRDTTAARPFSLRFRPGSFLARPSAAAPRLELELGRSAAPKGMAAGAGRLAQSPRSLSEDMTRRTKKENSSRQQPQRSLL